MADPTPHPLFEEAAIAAVIDQAAHQLAAVAQSQHITVLIAWLNRPETITPSAESTIPTATSASPTPPASSTTADGNASR